MTDAEPAGSLQRHLGPGDAVIIGLGSMIGAGVFAAFGPAAGAAGAGLLIGLAIAAVIAYCNATSSAQLAARYPESGGTYVYGRRRLGAVWGYLAGWGFVVGKTASCAAMALTIGAYAWPQHPRPVAVAAAVLLTVVNYFGIAKTALLTRLLVALTLIALTLVVVACLAGGTADADRLSPIWPGSGPGAVHAVLQAAALLFFAFAGYARIATLGEEVRDPTRTIPKAIPAALGLTVGVYLLVGLSALLAVGPDRLAAAVDPLAVAVSAGRLHSLTPAVRVGGVVASLGVLLSLLAGVGRTTLAMARERDLPGWLAAVHPTHGVPHRAELLLGGAVIVIVTVSDVRGAIGFSSFAILVYYAVANASAFTLDGPQRRWLRPLALVGGAGCVVLALTLPAASILTGLGVLTAGIAVRAARRP
ncbi:MULTISPECIES: APC family permease [unclassified Frankia]|uniref:APC family permease n=1 Tax=unclassified Frankia TaxID=2632575 RepID=UPI002AD34C6C|nr:MULTISPECIES: APC family permease [unclassified Frankia]